jgi:hypothetical protein
MDEGFFAETFRRFIIENHPDIFVQLGDDFGNYIKGRADTAAGNYENLVKSGVEPGFAVEEVITLMKEGLLFSKYNEIQSIIEEYFFDVVENLSERDRTDFLIKLISICEDTFNKYGISDDYSYNDSLTTELIGTIAFFLHR